MDAKRPVLNLVVIRSADLDRAAAFYGALGLVFDRHRHGKGPEHLAAELGAGGAGSAGDGGAVFEVYPLAKGQAPTTSTRIGFRVDDVDTCLVQLERVGGQIVTRPQDSEWGRRAVVQDPDGHRVELIAPTDADAADADAASTAHVPADEPAEPCPRCGLAENVEAMLVLLSEGSEHEARSPYRPAHSEDGGFTVQGLKPEHLADGALRQFVQGRYCRACGLGFIPESMAKPAAPRYMGSPDGVRRLLPNGDLGPLRARIADDRDPQ